MHTSVQGQHAGELFKSKTHELPLNQTTSVVLKLALIKRRVYLCKFTSWHSYRAFHTEAKPFLHGNP